MRLGRPRSSASPSLALHLGRLAAEEVLRVLRPARHSPPRRSDRRTAPSNGGSGRADRAASDWRRSCRCSCAAGTASASALSVRRTCPALGERAVILPLRSARAAMELDARKGMVLAQQDEGEAFVVAQQDIVGRAEALDELRLEQQRFGFAFGRDDRHRPGLRRPCAAGASAAGRPACSWSPGSSAPAPCPRRAHRPAHPACDRRRAASAAS